MRAVVLLFLLASPALAGSLEDRLGDLEYAGRIQRADMDSMLRQQALDAQDARERADRAATDRMLDQLERGPSIPPPPGWPQR